MKNSYEMDTKEFELLIKDIETRFNRMRGGNISIEQYDEFQKLFKQINSNILLPASTISRSISKKD